MDEEIKDCKKITKQFAKTSDSVRNKYRVLKTGKLEISRKIFLSSSSNLWHRSKTLSVKNLMWNRVK